MAAGTMADRARAAVRAEQAEGARVWLLAVTPDYAPPHAVSRESDGGVPRTAPEVEVGERAIVSRVVAGMVPADLAAWARQARTRGGGFPELARSLLGLDTIPRRVPGPNAAQSAEWHAYRAELRKLEEYAQGKYAKPTGPRAERIGRSELGRARVNLWAGGQWEIDEPGRAGVRFHWFVAEWEEAADRPAIREALAAGGPGLVAAVEAAADRIVQPYGAELLRVAGLRVEVMERG